MKRVLLQYFPALLPLRLVDTKVHSAVALIAQVCPCFFPELPAEFRPKIRRL
jgi:hypothetical protein